MAYDYTLLAPIDFSTRDLATDAQVTNVQRLKNAAYDDSARGTLSFFLFYRPIIEQYVSEFARLNPFFEEKESDLFWLTMRHAFALLRSYEHKGYGSFRNLLRQLVNYNALNAADKMVYMEEISLYQRESRQGQFVNMAIMCLVLQRNPKFTESKIIRDFIFHPKRMADISEAETPAAEALLEEFESEVDALSDKYANSSEEKGDIEALKPILGEKQLAELIRWGPSLTARLTTPNLSSGAFGKIPPGSAFLRTCLSRTAGLSPGWRTPRSPDPIRAYAGIAAGTGVSVFHGMPSRACHFCAGEGIVLRNGRDKRDPPGRKSQSFEGGGGRGNAAVPLAIGIGIGNIGTLATFPRPAGVLNPRTPSR